MQQAIERDGRKSAVRTLFGVVAACPGVNGPVPYLFYGDIKQTNLWFYVQ
jgi:hypothetical protein